MTPLEQVGRLGSVPLTIDVAIECGTLNVARVLEFELDTVIRSSRPAGDNVDIRVGGRLIAYGEIVALDGMAGVRITQLKEQQ